MDINAAYREVGTYRGAADICGTTPKTVKRIVEAAERTGQRGEHTVAEAKAVMAAATWLAERAVPASS